jgi:hypothetical protein
VWIDGRNGADGVSALDVYAQRILGDGTIAPGWPLNGAPVTRARDDQLLPVIVSDGAGGAYVVWQDARDYATLLNDTYAQHLTATGEVAPGWPANGLAVCALPNEQFGDFGILPDGTGGVLLAWNDERVVGHYDTYAQHLLADGTIAPGWTANGLPIAPARSRPRVATDGAGGFYLCSATDYGGSDLEYYVQRWRFTGTTVPGWPAGGIKVCSAAGTRAGLEAVADGFGGVLLAWWDGRPSPSHSTEIYALRVRPDGSRAPGWIASGTRVSEDTAPDNEYHQTIAPDGLGGAYLAWEQESYLSQQSTVQHLTPSGSVAPGWPPYGTRLAPTLGQYDPRVVEDGSGGAIVVWRYYHLYAQRFVADGPVATTLSLVSASVANGRVVLDWFAADGTAVVATLERRTATTDWRPIGAVNPDGTGHLRYEDAEVSAGERYAYRLSYHSDGAAQFTTETWVDVPLGAVLALEGARPNPVVGAMNASFSLASGEPATLSVIDVTGRQVLAREVGSLGAGRHVVPMDLGARVAPGLYWLRLSQGGRSLLAKAVVIK